MYTRIASYIECNESVPMLVIIVPTIISTVHPSITLIQNSFHVALNGYRKYMKGSPSDSTVAMLAEALSPKHERHLRGVYKPGPPFGPPVMKHKLLNRNQLHGAERRCLPRRRYFSVKNGPLNRNPRFFSMRKAMKERKRYSFRYGKLSLLFFYIHLFDLNV